MSKQHPIIAVTGASGAGTTLVQQAFKEIFFRQKIQAAFVQGDGFSRYGDKETEKRCSQALSQGRHISSYGPELNDFSRLENSFKEYAESGVTSLRYKVTAENKHLYPETEDGFTEWQSISPDSDCLFYEGMHGGVVAKTWTRRKVDNQEGVVNDRRSASSQSVDAAQHVDLLIGVVPAINLEWMQRIHHHQKTRELSAEQVTDNILDQLQDYIYFIVPQFSLCDINFQRMPVVDTSNPFEMQRVPNEEESVIVISFKDPHKFDLNHYVDRIEGASHTNRNSLLIPGGQLQHALDIICSPLIEGLVEDRTSA